MFCGSSRIRVSLFFLWWEVLKTCLRSVKGMCDVSGRFIYDLYRRWTSGVLAVVFCLIISVQPAQSGSMAGFVVARDAAGVFRAMLGSQTLTSTQVNFLSHYNSVGTTAVNGALLRYRVLSAAQWAMTFAARREVLLVVAGLSLAGLLVSDTNVYNSTSNVVIRNTCLSVSVDNFSPDNSTSQTLNGLVVPCQTTFENGVWRAYEVGWRCSVGSTCTGSKGESYLNTGAFIPGEQYPYPALSQHKSKVTYVNCASGSCRATGSSTTSNFASQLAGIITGTPDQELAEFATSTDSSLRIAEMNDGTSVFYGASDFPETFDFNDFVSDQNVIDEINQKIAHTGVTVGSSATNGGGVVTVPSATIEDAQTAISDALGSLELSDAAVQAAAGTGSQAAVDAAAAAAAAQYALAQQYLAAGRYAEAIKAAQAAAAASTIAQQRASGVSGTAAPSAVCGAYPLPPCEVAPVVDPSWSQLPDDPLHLDDVGADHSFGLSWGARWLPSSCPAPMALQFGSFGSHDFTFDLICQGLSTVGIVFQLFALMTAAGIVIRGVF